MEVVLWLALGLVAGMLAMLVVYRAIPPSPEPWIGAVVSGLLGGWLGARIAHFVGLEQANWIGSLVVSFLGVFVLLKLLRSTQPDS